MSTGIEVHGYDGLRARIADDGAVHDSKGVLLGYINEDGSAGDSYVYLCLSHFHFPFSPFLLGLSSGFCVSASSRKMR